MCSSTSLPASAPSCSVHPQQGQQLLQTTEANTPLGYGGYCGTFEVRDGQAIHHVEFHVVPRHNGRVEARTVVLDGDRLTLGTPFGAHLEWQRVQ